MGISVFPLPSAASKTRYVETLTSGSSWTVPAGVTYVNATLIGGSGGGGGGANFPGIDGNGGNLITTKVNTTPGASISYSIGAGGTAGAATSGNGGNGGNTTFTGATTATGGTGGARGSNAEVGKAGNAFGGNGRGGQGGAGQDIGAGAGAAGCIILEYWL